MPQRQRYDFKVAEDEREMYMQMFRPNTTKMMKSLLIEPERISNARAGEAWIESNGSEIVYCILLEGSLLTGNVVEVSEGFIRVQVGKEAFQRNGHLILEVFTYLIK